MSDVPHSVWQGSFSVFGVEVKCHVLDDGQRIIEIDSMKALLAAMAGDNNITSPGESPDLTEFARWVHGK